MNSLILSEIADFLEQNSEKLAQRAVHKIYAELNSYRNGNLSIDESCKVLNAGVNFIVQILRDGSSNNLQECGPARNEIEKVIFNRRSIQEISLDDLMKASRIFNREIWREIAGHLSDKKLSISDFLSLESRINEFVYAQMEKIASSYSSSLTEIIGHQASDLLKWEEVVKSASSIELKIPCRGEFAAIVRLQAEAIARRLKYTEEEIQDIKVAVGEACDNAIEHGDSDKGIDVHYHLSTEELTIEVIDYGCGFDPSGKGEDLPDFLSERGRGLFLMKALVDRVEVYSRPCEGTMLILVKKREFKD